MKALVVSAVVVAAVALGWSLPSHADDPPAIGAIPLSEILSTLDRNGNGCVDLEEGRNYASRRFHALDRNHDASLDAEEAPPGPDETSNSRPISIADWQDAYHARFAAFDTDRSGCLSLQEVEAGRNARKGGH
jgi:hypothetical protein